MEFLKIGQIVNSHGINGEVKLYPYSDDLKKLSKYKSMYIDEKPIKIEKISIFKNMLIIKFENILSLDEAKKYINKYVYIPKEKIEKDDTYYVEDLIGIDVYKTYEDSLDFNSYQYMGKITYVYTQTANDVYEVKTEKSTVYLPAIKDVIKKVDINNKKMFVKILEGLED